MTVPGIKTKGIVVGSIAGLALHYYGGTDASQPVLPGATEGDMAAYNSGALIGAAMFGALIGYLVTLVYSRLKKRN